MDERRRLGLLVPSSDIAMEDDLWRRLPPGVTLHVSRMHLESTTVAGEEKMLDEELAPAARRVAAVRPELAVFGCTSAAALRGLDGDAAIAALVEETVGAPCVTVIQAAFHEIQHIQPRRLLLATPYLDELNERMERTFRAAGLPLTGVVGLGLDDDLDIGAVPPQRIHEFVLRATQNASPAPDCVFVSCTTFRAFEAAEGLEQELGIPVVTSNRSVFQAIMRHLGEV
jgi:maleate isomerase